MKYILSIVFLILQVSVFAQSDGVQTQRTEFISIGERIQLYSEVLNENREIYIYVPEGFWGMDEDMENLPVIYVLDGETHFLSTVSTVDFLSAAPTGNDFMPRSIIVGIPNTNRNRDLTPIKGNIGQNAGSGGGSGGGLQFLEFITTELIPYIDNNYSTCDHRTIIGHSLGGLLTFAALIEKNQFFNNYLAIDTGFGFAEEAYMNYVIDTLESAEFLDENLYFAAANTTPTFIELEDLLSDTSDMLYLIDIPNRKFLNKSEKAEWDIQMATKYYPDENHYSIPHIALYDGMRHFYNFYTFKDMNDFYHPAYANKNDLLERLVAHYNNTSELMGCEIIPMEGYLNSFAFGLGHYGRGDMAVELLQYNITLHPDSPGVYINLGYYYRNNGNVKQAIEQFNKSLELQPDQYIIELRDELLKE